MKTLNHNHQPLTAARQVTYTSHFLPAAARSSFRAAMLHRQTQGSVSQKQPPDLLLYAFSGKPIPDPTKEPHWESRRDKAQLNAINVPNYYSVKRQAEGTHYYISMTTFTKEFLVFHSN